MYTEQELKQAKKTLKENKQENILNILEKLDDNKKGKLIKQILNLDFAQLNKLYAETKAEPEILEKKIEHIGYVDEYKLTENKKNRYITPGENIIKNNISFSGFNTRYSTFYVLYLVFFIRFCLYTGVLTRLILGLF